jgi:hypothetical protein
VGRAYIADHNIYIIFDFVLNIVVTENVGQMIILMITTFLLTNIPTVILLAIYFSVKKRKVHE